MLGVLVACVLGLLAGAGPARASFPGPHGKIAVSTLSAWEELDIVAMNADGSVSK